jgi:hypothetical protein
MSEALAERRDQRDRLIGLAREYVDRLRERLPVVAAAVVGSVARGDFNVWSDVDVVIVAEGLPDRAPDRAAVLTEDSPGGVQPVGYRPQEFRAAWAKGNRLVREAVERGIPLEGEPYLRATSADA